MFKILAVVRILTPLTALSLLNSNKKFQFDDVDLFFRLIHQPKPAFFDNLEGYICSSKFKDYCAKLQHPFSPERYLRQLLLLFAFLPLKCMEPILEKSFCSHSKILLVFRTLPVTSPPFKQIELEKLKRYLEDRFNPAHPFECVSRLSLILQLRKLNLLFSMDNLFHDIHQCTQAYLTDKLFYDSRVATEFDWYQYIMDANHFHLVDACINIQKISKEGGCYSRLLKVLFQESFLNQDNPGGSIYHLMGVGNCLPTFSDALIIFNHNRRIRTYLLDKKIDLSIVDAYKPEIHLLSFDAIIQQKQSKHLNEKKEKFLGTIRTLMMSLAPLSIHFDYRQALLTLKMMLEDDYALISTHDGLKRKIVEHTRHIFQMLTYEFDILSKQSSNQKTLSMCRQPLGNLVKMSKDFIKSLKKKAPDDILIQIRIWDRNPCKEFTLGRAVDNCLSPASSNFYAILERLADQSMFATILEINNPYTFEWQIACINWIFIGKDLNDSNKFYLVANYHNIANEFSKPSLRLKLLEAITTHTQQLANRLNIPYIIRPHTFGILPGFPILYDLHNIEFPFKTIRIALRKVGGYLPELTSFYYLDAESLFPEAPQSFYQLIANS